MAQAVSACRPACCLEPALCHILDGQLYCDPNRQELKQEVGLGHYEGRGWRGFHHHATLCIAADGFLIAEQPTIPPSGPCSSTPFQAPVLPDNYRPGGSALAA
jgi:hypothetical protein